MAETITPEQRTPTPDELASALCVTLDLPFVPGMEGHACIAAVIQVAVEAERARWVKAATDVARDATAAGNEHAAAGALAVSMRMSTTEPSHDR